MAEIHTEMQMSLNVTSIRSITQGKTSLFILTFYFIYKFFFFILCTHFFLSFVWFTVVFIGPSGLGFSSRLKNALQLVALFLIYSSIHSQFYQIWLLRLQANKKKHRKWPMHVVQQLRPNWTHKCSISWTLACRITKVCGWQGRAAEEICWFAF